MVDDGAASQPKRSDAGSAAIGPRVGGPLGDAHQRGQVLAQLAEAHRRSQRRQTL